MKKIIGTLLCVILAIGCFAGCQKVNREGIVEDEAALLKGIDFTADEEYEGELKIMTTAEESEADTINALVTAFQDKYPGIQVTVDNSTVMSGYYGKLTNNASAAASSGDHSLVADVFWCAPDFTDTLYQADMLMPLTLLDNKDDSIDTEAELLSEALMVSKINNKLYLMPRDYNQVVMYYNQKMLEDVGMSLPTAQMTQNQFMDYLAELRAKIDNSQATNKYGVKYSEAVKYLLDVNAGWDSWVWPLFKSFGSEVVDEEGKSTFDSEETLEALKFWQTIVNEGYASAVKDGGNVGVQFRMQQAPFLFHSRAWTTSLVKKTDQIKGVSKLGVTAVPQFGKNYAVGGGSSGYCMYKYSSHKTESWLFLKFVASEAGQNAFSNTGNCVPSRKSLLESDTAAWRTWTHERLGTGFDNDAFVYKLGEADSPFTSTREFYQYVPFEAQSTVLSCLQATLQVIDTAKTEKDLTDKITSQAQLIDYYVTKYQKKK